jgi:ferredoxin
VRTMWQVHFEGSARPLVASDDRSILESLARTGRGDLPIGCRGGGCGVCKVQVISGDVERRRASVKHLSDAEIIDGYALACRLFPRSDVQVRQVRTEITGDGLSNSGM